MKVEKMHDGHKLVLHMDAVDDTVPISGIWRNITGREQTVFVLDVSRGYVKYEWKDSDMKNKVFTKSIEHFLRSYKPSKK